MGSKNNHGFDFDTFLSAALGAGMAQAMRESSGKKEAEREEIRRLLVERGRTAPEQQQAVDYDLLAKKLVDESERRKREEKERERQADRHRREIEASRREEGARIRNLAMARVGDVPADVREKESRFWREAEAAIREHTPAGDGFIHPGRIVQTIYNLRNEQWTAPLIERREDYKRNYAAHSKLIEAEIGKIKEELRAEREARQEAARRAVETRRAKEEEARKVREAKRAEERAEQTRRREEENAKLRLEREKASMGYAESLPGASRSSRWYRLWRTSSME